MMGSTESLLAAYNFVKTMYATGAALKFLGRAIVYDEWDQLARKAEVLARTRPEIALPPGVALNLGDVQAALRASNAWTLISGSAGLVFTHLYPTDNSHFPVLLLTPDGRLVVYPSPLSGIAPVEAKDEERLSLVEGATAPIFDPGDRPGSLARVIPDTLWTISVTADDGLAFRFKGELELAIFADGRAWSSSNYGFCALGEACALDEESPLAAPELKRLWPPYSLQEAYRGWSIAVTYSGCLAISKSGQPKLVLRPDGALWSAGAGGWVKTCSFTPHPPPNLDDVHSIVSLPLDLPEPSYPGGGVLGAGPITAGGETYFTAGLLSGAASKPDAWFAGAPGNMEEGYDVHVDWSGVSLDSFTRWLGL